MRRMTMQANGIDLDVRVPRAMPEAPLLLFLHGFPEYAGGWDEVLPAFAGTAITRWRPTSAAMPARASREGVEAYAIKHLVRDMLALGRPAFAGAAVRAGRARLGRLGGLCHGDRGAAGASPSSPSSMGCIRGRSSGR